ncbi:hypothetical protein DICPUDRAFT_85435 [Dictyostelium purpureum]|uniref:Dickkopf N-terminal cysteine-rich domain-containing protein n=1 Tax=Dictyostelium purpureum TaxID=5786 RepID=F1A5Q3_DICPU|nr:uncharacterized protein DICPUDRAFT_85435 [Dictyostelium purpureum]EGC28476.1 hypothetical protein DICPUDRAFT_85435 [Dictyostelium purpureum]|eukprot:XP_003294997.1 hypothetical protein DICPUDRAFT_85435 [Dictyostelium purpureum]
MKIIFIYIFLLILWINLETVRACFNFNQCPQIGESCKGSCAPGLKCVGDVCVSMDPCDPNLPITKDTCTLTNMCTKKNDTVGVCLPYIAELSDSNAPCSRAENCASNRCENSKCVPPQTNICYSDNNCPYNYYCFLVGVSSSGNNGDGVCVPKTSRNCESSNECSTGYTCIYGICVPIFSGKENDDCIAPETLLPTNNPCDVGLICSRGKCVKYEEKACNSTVSCSSYETCKCINSAVGENGVCKIHYKFDAECKNATSAIMTCADNLGVSVNTNNYVLQESCSREYCDYKNKCFNSQFFGCGQTELYKMCPSYNYTIDSSDVPESSGSTQTSSQSSFSSSEDSVNSSFYTTPSLIVLILILIVSFF